MKKLEIKNIDCHATLAMIEKRWGFPRCTLRALLGMTKSGQSGRSMIEMLGVLAIIGVLSVGGIAGYSKAMMKYKINRTIEQITMIAGNARSFFTPQRSYNGLSSYTADGLELLRKAKLIPNEMWNNYGRNDHLFGDGGSQGSYGIQSYAKVESDACKADILCNNQAFRMHFAGIPTEACIDIITQDLSKLDANAYYIYNSNAFLYLNYPVDLETASKVCSANASKSMNIYIYFDFDTTQGSWPSNVARTKQKLADM